MDEHEQILNAIRDLDGRMSALGESASRNEERLEERQDVIARALARLLGDEHTDGVHHLADLLDGTREAIDA